MAQSIVLAQQIHVDSLPINHIQTIGSHNSYRKPMDKRILGAIRLLDLFYGKNPSPAQQLEYVHLPFDQQFETYGIRGLEIDIHYDPEGGRYFRTKGNIIGAKKSGPKELEMQQPGLKVFHISDVDFNSHYPTFKKALMAVKTWSDAHPRHLPIYILVEPKEDGVGNHVKAFGFVPVLPFDSAALESIDHEIREVFAGDLQHILTPDDVRGKHATLNEAILTQGWPLLAEARGKVVFIMNGSLRHTELYAQNHPSFRGRMMFSFSEVGREDAAFIKIDDAFSLDIAAMVQQGYMVRTRTDSPGYEAPINDHRTKNAAFLSGAQLLSTDYYLADKQLSPYKVQFENNQVGRLNFMQPDSVHVGDWQEK
jgi:hypothetical protein